MFQQVSTVDERCWWDLRHCSQWDPLLFYHVVLYALQSGLTVGVDADLTVRLWGNSLGNGGHLPMAPVPQEEGLDPHSCPGNNHAHDPVPKWVFKVLYRPLGVSLLIPFADSKDSELHRLFATCGNLTVMLQSIVSWCVLTWVCDVRQGREVSCCSLLQSDEFERECTPIAIISNKSMMPKRWFCEWDLILPLWLVGDHVSAEKHIIIAMEPKSIVFAWNPEKICMH